MSFNWTAEQVNKLLSLIIFTQYPKGKTPDYDFLAEHIGASREAVRQKFSGLRRDFEAKDHTAVGAKQPRVRKRTKKEAKEDFDEDEVEDKKPVKKSRSGKVVAKSES
jgi:hypothetical protein